ncbi:MAG: 2,3-bisphosphoglycerate-independent phosphoglycerate mutase [Candidatus Kerfeldbacteria bacterium]|nr:2,3-bisphosphoglycerate-independent phosphoglycerate mutase [Candidatus Kerfeldbacteria bacterium]
MITPQRQPAVLVILDGFGVAPPSRGNAIALAKTPNLDRLIESYPTMTLQASGEAVGLPWGEMGNSEVGHLTIGAGKAIYQDLPRITRSIVDGSFFTQPAFLDTMTTVKAHRSRLHLLGMFSTAGVHSFDEHAYALLELCQRQKLSNVFLHVILDGRDSPYNSGQEFIAKVQNKIATLGLGRIATVMGRYYAMDRDNRWDRTAAAYQAMTAGRGPQASDPLQAVLDSYRRGVYDEQMVPTVITAGGKPVATVSDHDAVIFFNFRSDRARQLTKAFVLPGFEKFSRPEYLKDVTFVTMTEYERDLPVTIAFPPESVTTPLAKVYSDAGLHQLHIAETEKYAHVTFFFNGGLEQPFPNEDRVLIPSPSVAAYDQKPDMSARSITERLVQELNTGKYALIVANFANSDMIGHTGNIPATIRAIETLDWCAGEIVQAALSINGLVIITADHGNAEAKIDSQTGAVSKEHSANPVPFIVVANDLPAAVRQRFRSPMRDLSSLTPVGVLADVGPTLLSLVGLPTPPEMSGHNLFAFA